MRNLSPDLQAIFDRGPHLLSPDASVTGMIAQLIMSAKDFNGTTNPFVISLMRGIITRDTGQAWCMDFVQSCVAYIETLYSVKSPLPAMEWTIGTWQAAPWTMKPGAANIGDVIIWEHADLVHGHTGIIVGVDSISYTTIEGNTTPPALSAPGQIQASGDGIYLKTRAKGGSATFKELGFLRPFF